MRAHREPKCLADDCVEWDGEEIATEGEQTYSENSVEFAPLSLFFESFVYKSCLFPFSD